MNEWLLLGFVVLLIAANALFVAAEFSLVTADRATVERNAKNGDRRSQGVLAALKSLSTQLSGAQLGITVTSLVVGVIAEPSIAALLRGPLEAAGISGPSLRATSVSIAFVIATITQMVLGELVPKNLGIAKPIAVARYVAGPQRAFTSSTRWLINFLNGTANRILRRLGIEPQEELQTARSTAELNSVVDRSRVSGDLDSDTARLLSRSLRFGDRAAADVMTPRNRIQAIEVSEPASSVIQAVSERGHSRFPVIDGDMDNIVGVVHIKHAVALELELRSTTQVREIMVEPLVVPASIQLESLLGQIREQGLQMAVLVDEYGGTDGIVTLEDLVEEIVGDIDDEFDRPGSHVRRRRDGSWSLAGVLRPDEIHELTSVQLPEDEEYETIAGLVLDHLGRLPEAGDFVGEFKVPKGEEDFQIARLSVERMDGMRIDRVRMKIEPMPEQDASEGGQ
jgi:CBS domain containing-hemolysin-like protein